MFNNILSFIYGAMAVNGDHALEVTRRLRVATAVLFQFLAVFAPRGGVNTGGYRTPTLSWIEEAQVFDGFSYGSRPLPIIPGLLSAWPSVAVSVRTSALSISGSPVPTADSGTPVFNAESTAPDVVIIDDTVKTVLLALVIGLPLVLLVLFIHWFVFERGRSSNEKIIKAIDIYSVLKAPSNVGQWVESLPLIGVPSVDVNGSRSTSSSLMQHLAAVFPPSAALQAAVVHVQELGEVNAALSRDNGALKSKEACHRVLRKADRREINRLEGRVRSLAAGAFHVGKINIALKGKVGALDKTIANHLVVRADNRRVIEELDEAIASITVSHSLANVRIEELKDENHKCKAEREQAVLSKQAADEEACAQLEAQLTRIEELRRDLAAAQDARAEDAKKSYDDLQSRFTAQLEEAKKEHASVNERLAVQLEDAKEDNEDLRERLSGQQAKLEHANVAYALLQGSSNEQVERNTQLREAKVKVMQERSELRAKNISQLHELFEAKVENRNLAADVTRLHAELDRTVSQRDGYSAQLDKAGKDHTELNERLKKAEAEILGVRAERSKLAKEKFALLEEVLRFRREHPAAKREAIELSALVNRLREGFFKQNERAAEEREAKDVEIAALHEANAQSAAEFTQYRVTSQRLLQTLKDESDAAIARLATLHTGNLADFKATTDLIMASTREAAARMELLDARRALGMAQAESFELSCELEALQRAIDALEAKTEQVCAAERAPTALRPSPSLPHLSRRKTAVQWQAQQGALTVSHSVPTDLRRCSAGREAQVRRA